MMIAVAGDEMTYVALRFLSASGRSPHGSLSSFLSSDTWQGVFSLRAVSVSSISRVRHLR